MKYSGIKAAFIGVVLFSFIFLLLLVVFLFFREVPDADSFFMKQAYEEAALSLRTHDFPVGALVVLDDRIISRAHNSVVAYGDPKAHAEMLAIDLALKSLGCEFFSCKKNHRITLYTTYEPCPLCSGYIQWSKMPRVVVGKKNLARRFKNFLDHLAYFISSGPEIDPHEHDRLWAKCAVVKDKSGITRCNAHH